MARTDLKVQIDAEAAQLERELAKSAAAMGRFETSIRKASLAAAQLNKAVDDEAAAKLRKQGEVMTKVGTGALVFGAAMVAGLGLAAKAAIDWQTAWAGVTKTTSGTPEQMAALEVSLRHLATTLPQTHREIAGVAEAAGQLGIARQDIASFTKVMLDLGVSTNLTSDEAATGIAQLMNVMQTAPANVSRLGATLVLLGNNGASTERDILELAQRISGAGHVIGLSEANVLSFANALASVGIDAEAGGTAISTTMVKVAAAVAGGGETLKGFAAVAGMTSAQFTEEFKTAPAVAINSFITGLGRITTNGGNVFNTLTKLSLGNIRTRDTLLRLAGAGDILTQSLADGDKGWAQNTALVNEAEKRYKTTASQIGIARNNITDTAITIGNDLLPALSGAATFIGDLAKGIGALPGPLKTVVTMLGATAGIVALVGGAALIAVPKIVAFRASLEAIGGRAATLNAGIGAIGRALGTWLGPALAIGTVAMAVWAAKTGEAKKVADDFAQAIKADAGAVGSTSIALVAKTLTDGRILDKARELGIALEDVNAAALGDPAALSRIKGIGNAIAVAQSKIFGPRAAANTAPVKDFQEVLSAVQKTSKGISDGTDTYKKNTNAADDLAAAQKGLGEKIDPVTKKAEEMAVKFSLVTEEELKVAGAAQKAAQKMLDSWSAAFSSFVSATGAYDDALKKKEDAEKTAAEKTAAATKSGKDSWQDFVKGVTLSIGEYLKELEAQVKAQQDWQKNLTTLAAKLPADVTKALVEMGPKGAALVAMLTKGTPAELAKFVALFKASGKDAGDEFAAGISEASLALQTVAEQQGTAVALKIAQYMNAHKVDVYNAAKALGVAIDDGLGGPRNVVVTSTFKGLFNGPPGSIAAPAAVTGPPAGVSTGNLLHKASGGYVNGPGTATSDSVMAMLSKGEFVMNAAATSYFTPEYLQSMNSMRFAAGGPVTGRAQTAGTPVQVKGGMTINGLNVQANSLTEITDSIARQQRLSQLR